MLTGLAYYYQTSVSSRSQADQDCCFPSSSSSSNTRHFYITRTFTGSSKTCYEEIELKCRSAILLDRYRLLSRLQQPDVVDLDRLQLKLAHHHELSAIKSQQQEQLEENSEQQQLLLTLTQSNEYEEEEEEATELDNNINNTNKNLDKDTADQFKQFVVKQHAKLENKVKLKDDNDATARTVTSLVTRRESNRLKEIRENFFSRFSLDHWRMLTARNLHNTTLLQNSKSVMISYCHAEARDEAKSLKRALEAMNISVYLDLDEILPGHDWQDSLNHAVLGCQALIALVSRSYGRTQWTSREFKLADLLGKLIIPVRLDQRWPPAYLSLQLATLQYIEWGKAKNVAAHICQTIERHSHETKFAIERESHLMLVAGSTSSGSGSSSSSSGVVSENKCLLTSSVSSSEDEATGVKESVSENKQVVADKLEVEKETDDLEESFEKICSSLAQSSSSQDVEWHMAHSHFTSHQANDAQQAAFKEHKDTLKRDYLWLLKWRKVSYVLRHFSRKRSCKSRRGCRRGSGQRVKKEEVNDGFDLLLE